jgi:hypothetical protein
VLELKDDIPFRSNIRDVDLAIRPDVAHFLALDWKGILPVAMPFRFWLPLRLVLVLSECDVRANDEATRQRLREFLGSPRAKAQ